MLGNQKPRVGENHPCSIDPPYPLPRIRQLSGAIEDNQFSTLEAPQIGVEDFSAWPLELGLRTPTLRHGPSSSGQGLPPFGVAFGVGVLELE